MSIILRFFPNGEFTRGVSAVKRRDVSADRRHESIAEMIPVGRKTSLRLRGHEETVTADMISAMPGDEFLDRRDGVYTYLCNDAGIHTYAYEGKDGFVTVTTLYDQLHRCIQRGELTHIGLSNARILKEPCVSRKKCERMTTSMARKIRNAAYLLTRKYGKDQLSFLTLTLPSLSIEALSNICCNWDKIVHRFFMWLRQALNAKHIKPSFVYCTEIQTRRLNLRHEYAPHLHIIFRGRNGKKCAWGITPKMARSAWVRCIKSYTDECFDTRAIENLQRVRQDAGRYLSKYMSKGSNSLPLFDETAVGITSLRTHWGGMSRNLSKAIAQGITTLAGNGIRGENARIFLQAIPNLIEAGFIRYYNERIICVSRCPGYDQSRGLKVGAGCLKYPTFDGGLQRCLEFAYGLYEDKLCREL